MGALRGFDMRKYVMFLVEFRQGAVSVARVFDPCNPMETTMNSKHQVIFIREQRAFYGVESSNNQRAT